MKNARPRLVSFSTPASWRCRSTPMRGRYADERVVTSPRSRRLWYQGTRQGAPRVHPALPAGKRIPQQKCPNRLPIVFYLEPGSTRPVASVHQARHRGLAESFRERGVPGNAIIARDAPTAQEDPNWDPEDAAQQRGALDAQRPGRTRWALG